MRNCTRSHAPNPRHARFARDPTRQVNAKQEAKHRATDTHTRTRTSTVRGFHITTLTHTRSLAHRNRKPSIKRANSNYRTGDVDVVAVAAAAAAGAVAILFYCFGVRVWVFRTHSTHAPAHHHIRDPPTRTSGTTASQIECVRQRFRFVELNERARIRCQLAHQELGASDERTPLVPNAIPMKSFVVEWCRAVAGVAAATVKRVFANRSCVFMLQSRRVCMLRVPRASANDMWRRMDGECVRGFTDSRVHEHTHTLDQKLRARVHTCARCERELQTGGRSRAEHSKAYAGKRRARIGAYTHM